MSMFVERAAITTYVDTMVERKDALLSNFALVSAMPVVGLEGSVVAIRLTVGALYKDRQACCFNKKALAELIEELQAVHDIMK